MSWWVPQIIFRFIQAYLSFYLHSLINICVLYFLYNHTVHLSAGHESVPIQINITNYILQSATLWNIFSFTWCPVDLQVLSAHRRWKSDIGLGGQKLKNEEAEVGDKNPEEGCRPEDKFKQSRGSWFGLYLVFFAFMALMKWVIQNNFGTLFFLKLLKNVCF